MAEAAAALTALGVAANIFQFLDLAGRIAARGWKIYRDPTGRIEDVFDGSTLQNLAKSLHDSLGLLSPNARDCEAGMVLVAKDCSKVADRLLKQLQRIEELRRSGKKRDALKAAVVSVWKQDEMKALGERLEQFKSQLSLQLLVSIRSFMSPTNTREQKEAAIQLHELQSSTLEAKTMLQALRESAADPWTSTPGPSILQYICSKIPQSRPGVAKYALHQHLFEAIAANAEEVSTVYRLNEYPLAKASTSDRWSVQDKLQDQFQKVWKHDGTVDRLIQVSDAHIKTFRWIFEPPSRNDKPWSDFNAWLDDMDAPLYWVTGKPGSGKSTLMKFILTYQGDTTSQCGTMVEAKLPRAPLEPPWTIVHYFAWHAGQMLQRSIDGLCRSLIYQLAKHHPNALPTLLPSCWEAIWLLDDLGPQQMATLKDFRERKAFSDMVHEVTKTHKILFLIDGLDEIDGETEEATELILELADVPNIKICAASRPRPVFANSFNIKPHLIMQDLTKNDIVDFTTDRLSQRDGFSRLQRRDPAYASRLIDQVARKSAGVFLWVALVVKSLIQGLSEDDRMVDLEQRIDAIPNDLNKLFNRLLTKLDESHLNRAKRYFNLLSIHRDQYPGEKLTALELSFADESCPQFATRMAIEPLSDQIMNERVDTITRRIESVTMGLLEVVKVVSPRESRVDYLHRTVVDYLNSNMALDSLSMATESFRDSLLSIQLASAHLCLLKSMQEDSRFLWKVECEMFTKLVYKILSFAGRADRDLSGGDDIPEAQIVQVLDHLDNTGKRLAKLAGLSSPRTTPYNDPRVMVQPHILETLESGHWAWWFGIIGADDISHHYITPVLTDSTPYRKVLDVHDEYKTSGRTFLSLVVRVGICSYIKARAAPSCLVQRMEIQEDLIDGTHATCTTTIWPLLADALDNKCVDPRMVRQLLQLKADPGFLFYFPFRDEQTTPLQLAIGRAIYTSQNPRTDDNWSKDLEDMRQLLQEMSGDPGSKNLPRKAKAQLKTILNSAVTVNRNVHGNDSDILQLRPPPGYDREKSKKTEYGGLMFAK